MSPNPNPNNDDDRGSSRPSSRCERQFRPSECGRNGNPPPFAYQRRIDYLGPQPARNRMFRSDWLEVSTKLQKAGELSIRGHVVASVIAAASNAHGKDITYTHAFFAKQLHKANGAAYSAKFVARGLDELQAVGLIDWEHGQEAQRFDEKRCQMLGGRWQGACTYRMEIPDQHQAAIDERRRNARDKNTAGNGRTTPPARHRRPGRHHDDDRRAAIATDARRLAHNVATFDQGRAQLQKAYRGEEYEFAYDEFQDAWTRRGDP